MPTYQYACTECGHRLEAVQSFTDQALTDCPQCAGRLRKVFSAVGVVFKGSGFYRTDSRASNGAHKGAKDGDGSSTPKDGAGSKDSAGASESSASGKSGDKSGAKTGSGAPSAPAAKSA